VLRVEIPGPTRCGCHKPLAGRGHTAPRLSAVAAVPVADLLPSGGRAVGLLLRGSLVADADLDTCDASIAAVWGHSGRHDVR
jgi:hypothetical protein